MRLVPEEEVPSIPVGHVIFVTGEPKDPWYDNSDPGSLWIVWGYGKAQLLMDNGFTGETEDLDWFMTWDVYDLGDLGYEVPGNKWARETFGEDKWGTHK